MVTNIVITQGSSAQPAEIVYKKKGRKTTFNLGYDTEGKITSVKIRGSASLIDIEPMLPFPEAKPITPGEIIVRSNTATNALAQVYLVPAQSVLTVKGVQIDGAATGGGAAYLFHQNTRGNQNYLLRLDFVAAGHKTATYSGEWLMYGGEWLRVYSNAAAVVARACLLGELKQE